MRPNKKYLIIGASVVATVIGVGFVIFLRRKFLNSKKPKISANIALKEYVKWGLGSIKEGSTKTIQNIRDYWEQGAKIVNSDSWYINTAWSAAFISWIMRKAGYSNFKFNASHSVYIRDSIKNKKQNIDGFKGYKPTETKIEVGDLVCYPRQVGVNYDTTSAYSSHCDIVVAIDKGVAKTIGGNVSNSVTETIVPLKNGKIDLSKKPNYFVVIKPPK